MSGILENLNQISGAALAAVLNSLWQAIVVAAAGWGLLKVSPRINAATRHVLWWGMLAAVAALPLMQMVRDRAPAPAAPLTAEAVATEPDAAPAAEYIAPAPTSVPSAQEGSGARAVEIRAGAWPLWILGAWATVLFLQLGRIGWSYRYLRRLRERSRPAPAEMRRNFEAWRMSCGVRRPTRLLISSEIVSPVAIGFREPAVVLPETLLEQFNGTQLDHVLLHELAHIARRDDWTNLLVRICFGLAVLHPVAFWILRRIDLERETACDDWVVSMTGEARPYAASLARLFELCFARRRMILASGMAERSSHLGERIENLLQRKRNFSARPSSIPVLAGVAVLLIMVMSTVRIPRWMAWAQEPVPPAPPSMAVQPAPIPPPAAPAPAPMAAVSDLRAAAPPQPVPVAYAPVPPPADVPEPPVPPQQRATTVPAPALPPAQGSRESFLAALVAAGYGDLTVDQIIALKNAGVSARFLTEIKQVGVGKLSPQEMIDLTQHGVTPGYVQRMREAGVKNLSFPEILGMASSGVRPETVHEIHALGFGPYTAGQVIEFAHRGIRLELFRGLKDYGFANADPADIIDAMNCGLTGRDLGEARQYGSGLSLKQILKLKRAGVI